MRLLTEKITITKETKFLIGYKGQISSQLVMWKVVNTYITATKNYVLGAGTDHVLKHTDGNIDFPERTTQNRYAGAMADVSVIISCLRKAVNSVT